MLSNRFGYRPVVMMGGFLISLGTTTSAFTNSINDMYITIGIISGTYKDLTTTTTCICVCLPVCLDVRFRDALSLI